ncbi:hypothetical protein BCR15_01260 [Tessaracoccus lapidicaptus]|uniref:Uncharacterized protein n=1 Tax=Tessaracoccus lapidicaptus TaxID=1427523 RepID=A0A1C0AQN8_9ACTN|nr:MULTISPECIES: PH domain-containing protein [Tessaracoccus]AQX15162.1 hypothetical protein BKM78_03890 [Tessaracoccus sp. T2.5-30]OCL36525.1 hypothetical protein BCR15_01260 [Tessaracoccus lapidicaptus]VEP39385.1 hypothetical protein TLA_TLA_00793 [Tessaracoccus lapidicaptus]
MAVKPEELGQGELVVVSLRTHAKALIVPVVTLIATAAVVGAGIAVLPATWQPWGTYALVAVALIAVVAWVLLPLLRWATSTYTITDRRIITRRGILTRTGHDLPLRRITNVNYERSLTDRILGCGTLVFETAAGQPLRLPDVPDVERVHVAITELLFRDDEDRGE